MTDKPEVFKDWCDKPEVIRTGNGWGVRINGCDVFDDINQYGVKPLRSFDLVKGLSSKDDAEAYLLDWLKQQLSTHEASRAADKARIAELQAALRKVAGEVDGNIRECVRDCVNQRGNVQDIYDYCDNIDSAIDAALAQQGKEGGV